jgi:hypothetical protein
MGHPWAGREAFILHEAGTKCCRPGTNRYGVSPLIHHREGSHAPDTRIPPPTARPLEKATAERILSIRRWSEKLFSVKVSRSPAFRFTPGQWVRLGIPSGSGLPGSVIWRPYSMVSADYDEYLEFFSILVPGGAFSSRLAAAGVGDTLYVEKLPYGYLTAARFTGGRHLWLLASGTGVAPTSRFCAIRMPGSATTSVLAHCVSQARISPIATNWPRWPTMNCSAPAARRCASCPL